jgi:Bacterial Ig-like domain
VTRVALRTLLLVLLAASSGLGQSTGRRFTTVDALRQFPGFYHLQNVLVRGEFVEDGKRLMLRSDANDLRVVMSEGVSATKGPVEARGVLIDVGRLEPSDPRLTGIADLRDAERGWPRPGEELVVRVTGVSEAEAASAATVRSLTLEPWKFDGQTVTIVGNFRGRNLFGDLGGSPNKSKYDFVLRGAEGAVWVTSLRPKGDKFDLDINRRVDSDRWLEVTGKVVRERGLVSIEATRMKLTTAPEVRAAREEPVAHTVPLEPVQVVFSSPTDGETEVSPGATIRVQFSRGLNEASLADDIRISYVGAAGSAGSAVSTLPFGLSYDAGSRSIQIKMKEPFEAFRTVRVQLLDGAKGFDGAPVTPWTLTFSVGN